MRKQPEVRRGCYCARCGRTYVTLRWPLPSVCDWCSAGVDDALLYRTPAMAGRQQYDLPLGSMWVSS